MTAHPEPTETATLAPPSKVLLVEDHPKFREQLAQLISREAGLSICGQTDNIRDAMSLIRATKPDIAIVDITLQGSSGLELVKDARAQGVDLRLLVLSMHDEDLYAERVLRAGAQGYITKNKASSEVIKAIRTVLDGEVYVSNQVTARILGRIGQERSEPASKGLHHLSDRELEVFQMLGSGKTTPVIAQALNLGESTVQTYRIRIKEKLGLRSAAELYLKAGQWVRDQSQRV